LVEVPTGTRPLLIGILDVRLKDGAEKFRDRLAARLVAIKATKPGQSIRFAIEYTPYEGSARDAAARLVAQLPDILVAANDDAALVLKAATKNIPIVFQSYDDPVAGGIVRSLSAPDANLTGYNFYRRTHLKRWETLLQFAPKTRRIGVLLDPDYIPNGILLDMESSRSALGIHVVPLYLREQEPIVALAHKLSLMEIDAIDLPHDGHFTMNQQQTVVDISKLGVPASYDGELYCSWGGAVCFSRHNTPPENPAAEYIKLILSGARPSDIPISSPTQYDLSANAKTIKSLGLIPPQSILSIARLYE
jgi:putative tryptophan/tyrosine transport system substrate-binding protein